MANAGAARFYRRLVGIKCSRWKPPAETETEYVDRLSEWYLSPDEWNRALDMISQDANLDEGLPQLTAIYGYLKAAQRGRKNTKDAGPNWLLFTIGDRRTAVRVADPSNPPTPPDGATKIHLFISDPTNREPETDYRQDIKSLVETAVPF